MKPPVPPGANMGPPDVNELRDLIDQWAEFVGDLERKDYTFDLDNWRNDVDVRELILEALPMFSRASKTSWRALSAHKASTDSAFGAYRPASQ